MASLSAQLADRLLQPEGGLRHFIDSRRANGDSWHAIAFAFSTATGVITSGETIRRWTDEDETAEDPAA